MVSLRLLKMSCCHLEVPPGFRDLAFSKKSCKFKDFRQCNFLLLLQKKGEVKLFAVEFIQFEIAAILSIFEHSHNKFSQTLARSWMDWFSTPLYGTTFLGVCTKNKNPVGAPSSSDTYLCCLAPIITTSLPHSQFISQMSEFQNKRAET